MKAVVLAGGLGTRLHPLTINLPKPMVPVANRPLLAYVVELLVKHGFTDLSFLLYHLPQSIKNYFGDGRRFGVKISYFEAPEDYGTAGAVKFACGQWREPILVVSGDLLTGINLTQAAAFHRQGQAIATMALVKKNNPLSYGLAITDQEGRIEQFLEKPAVGEVFSNTVNAGIYLLEPAALAYIPEGANYDFSYHLFPQLIKEQAPIFGYITDGYWSDIGQLDDYRSAHLDLLANQGEIIGERTEIAPGARLINSVIGHNCRLERGAEIVDSVIWDSVEIGEEVKLEKVVLGRGVKIRAGARLAAGVVVGEGTEIGRAAEIRPHVKIWPHKIIRSGSTVSRSII